MAPESNPNHPSSHPPSATALLLLDYHNALVGFIQDNATRDRLIGSTQELVKAALANNVPVLHCLVDSGKDPLPTNKLTERWASTYKPMFTSQPEAAQEYADVAPASESSKEMTLKRHPGRTSALKTDGIIDLLKTQLGVKSVILCGISSSGCVLSTANEASDLDFVVTVVEDGCWDPKPDLHRAVMDHLLSSSVWVTRLDEAVGYLKGSSYKE
ncbi:putative hydrolase protein [Xylariales sp. AK1849]|nr:putative hydrolase protein [Xylariales sp. AK1849]